MDFEEISDLRCAVFGMLILDLFGDQVVAVCLSFLGRNGGNYKCYYLAMFTIFGML